MNKVCSKNAIWIFALMLIVPGSVLFAEDPPSSQDKAAGEAQPASTTPIPPALHQALASSLSEATSIGAKVIPVRPTGTWGIVSAGDGGGGVFLDSDSEAEAWLGSDGYGVQGFGSTVGGYFEDSDSSAYSYVGYGSYGIQSFGPFAGGYFGDTNDSGVAWLGGGDIGVQGEGTSAGGYFADSDLTSLTYVAYGDRGIEALGFEMGGYFKDWDDSGYAHVGFGDRGIEAYGTEMGGYLADSDGSGQAYVGYGDRGIQASGTDAGGYFADSDSSGNAYVGYGHLGIVAQGENGGGIFEDADDTALARVAYGEFGIIAIGSWAGGHFKRGVNTVPPADAYLGYDRPSSSVDRSNYPNGGLYGVYAVGSKAGGYFEDSAASGYSYVGSADYGIIAYGDYAGAFFADTDSSAYADVGFSTSKIAGSGAVSFVQNHPYDPSSVIVYAAPEGDEVATYTRGTARLVEGEATVPLGETFKWVTNPDIGLTAFLTPVSEWCDLYVVEQATDSIVVRSRDGSDCGFNYMVYGLRIGFEESSIVQEKKMESYIPSMADHRQLYQRRPDLKNYNSLERFKGMHHVANPKAKLDLSRAHALRDAIIEFDPAVHELPRPPGFEEMTREDGTSETEGQKEGVNKGARCRGIDVLPDHPFPFDLAIIESTRRTSSAKFPSIVLCSAALLTNRLVVSRYFSRPAAIFVTVKPYNSTPSQANNLRASTIPACRFRLLRSSTVTLHAAAPSSRN